MRLPSVLTVDLDDLVAELTKLSRKAVGTADRAGEDDQHASRERATEAGLLRSSTTAASLRTAPTPNSRATSSHHAITMRTYKQAKEEKAGRGEREVSR